MQHHPVEREPARERRESRGDDRRLVGRELAALVQQPHDRLGEHGGGDARRHEQERDLANAYGNGVAEAAMSPRAASLEIDGNSTVATATENIPCGSM